jgi:hypothetical protein
MSHLSIERLAALADEQPTTDELSHLSQCAVCARERDAHRALLAMAGSEREAMGLPLTRWDTLSHQLKAEGLIAGGRPEAGRAEKLSSHSPLPSAHWGLRAAAMILLVGGGVLLGRATTNDPLIPGIASGAATQSVAANAADSVRSFSSVDEANRWKEIYSTGYQRALAYLAQNDSGGQRPKRRPSCARGSPSWIRSRRP